jgi:hypothetical protein
MRIIIKFWLSFLCNVSLHANHRRITVRNLITTNNSIKLTIILTQHTNFKNYLGFILYILYSTFYNLTS